MFRPKKAKASSASLPLRTQSSQVIGAEVEAVETPVAPSTRANDGVVVIGKGTRISGSISDCQVLDVYGVVEADVTAERVIIREGGGIRGTIHTDNAEVSGVVEGALTAYEHLEINSTGEVWAEVKYQTLAVAKGAVLKGSIWIEDRIDQQLSEARDDGRLEDGDHTQIDNDSIAKVNGTQTDLSAMNGHAVEHEPASRPSKSIQRQMKT